MPAKIDSESRFFDPSLSAFTSSPASFFAVSDFFFGVGDCSLSAHDSSDSSSLQYSDSSSPLPLRLVLPFGFCDVVDLRDFFELRLL